MWIFFSWWDFLPPLAGPAFAMFVRQILPFLSAQSWPLVRSFHRIININILSVNKTPHIRDTVGSYHHRLWGEKYLSLVRLYPQDRMAVIWNPNLYLRNLTPRIRPALDLLKATLSALPPGKEVGDVEHIVDLGCGPGIY
jgi:hypothetical protein